VSRSGDGRCGRVGRCEKQPKGVRMAKRFPGAGIKAPALMLFNEESRLLANLHIFN